MSTMSRSFAAALTLVVAFAASPSAAEAGNLKHNGNHKHHGHFKQSHVHFGFNGHHVHHRHFHRPIVVSPVFGTVVAVPYGNGFVYVVK